MTGNDPNALYTRATERKTDTPVLHIRFEGKSRDIALDVLRLTASSSDEAIRLSVASFLDIAVEKLDGMVIERHPNGNMTIRPEAVFG